MALTMAAARYGYGVAWSALDWVVMPVMLLGCIGVHRYAAQSDDTLRRAGALVAVSVFVAVTVNILLSPFPVQRYGDSGFLVVVVDSVKPFSRWMSGSAVLSWIYAGLWKFPPISALLPASVNNAEGCVRLIGSLCMAGAAVAAVLSRRAPLAAYVTVTSTMWMVFSFGYVEYYPFIAGLMIVFMVWLFGWSWDRHSPRTLGVLLGVIASSYVGFWPLAAIVGVMFVIASPRRNWPAIAWAVLAFLCCVRIFWPQSPADFFLALWHDMNFGERFNYPRYVGLAAGPTSVYFKSSYVFSLPRLGELAYQCFFSGTLVPLLLLGGLLAAGVAKTSRRSLREWGSPARIAAALLLAYYFRYFLWKIPKLGPRKDIDLYFELYLLAVFFLGLVMERGAAGVSLVPAQRYLILSFLTGNALPLCYLFIYRGLPPI